MVKKIALACLLFILPLSIAPSTFAQKIDKNEVTTLSKDQIVDQDYFALGEKVTILGIVNGDAYVAGGNVIVEGEINGDLLIAGGTVNIIGKVSQDVRAAGGEVIISGEVGGNITTFSGSTTITDSAHIGGSLTSATGNLTVLAPIAKGATICAGEATFANRVGGNIMAAVNSLTLGPSSQIEGNLTYLSEKNADIQAGAQVSGETKHNFPAKPQKGQNEKALTAADLFFQLIGFLATLAIGLALFKFFPIITGKIAQTVETKATASLGIGLLTVILVPILFFVLLITIIGIPLGFILLFSFLLTLCFSKIFISVVIGRKIFNWVNKKAGDYQALFVGLIIYSLIGNLPTLGIIFKILATLTGVGAILITKKELYLHFRAKKLI